MTRAGAVTQPWHCGHVGTCHVPHILYMWPALQRRSVSPFKSPFHAHNAAHSFLLLDDRASEVRGSPRGDWATPPSSCDTQTDLPEKISPGLSSPVITSSQKKKNCVSTNFDMPVRCVESFKTRFNPTYGTQECQDPRPASRPCLAK